jgi:hypothetical protein
VLANFYAFRGFGATVRIRAPEWVTLDRLVPYLARELTEAPVVEGPAEVSLVPTRQGYRIEIGERWFGPYHDEDGGLRGIASGLHYMLARQSPMTFIHAGAVEIDGRAFVFPGSSGYGKSVLVTRLVEAGCGYLSDEWAVISPEGTVFPLSKPIRLRVPGGNSYVRPSGVSTPGGFPCAAFVFTKFVQDARWDPRPISPGQAVLRSIPEVVRCSDASQQTLEALTRATSGAVCIRSRRGEDEPTPATLRELAGTPNRSRVECSTPSSLTPNVLDGRAKEAVR